MTALPAFSDRPWLGTRSPLEGSHRELPMPARLVVAAERLDADPRAARSFLRAHQAPVLADVAAFLEQAASRSASEPASFGRIVLPPRTGKTIIAAHVIAGARLATTFIVPTKTLVEQTVAVLADELPDVPIGAYYGEAKGLVEDGVNVATYAILQRDAALRSVAGPIARSGLIFVDEAHHAMTDDRMALLRGAFAPEAVRIALTATPDYDEQRVLCRHFPVLVHEITLEEAVALNLLAPLRLWVAEVDEDASRVRVVAGDYDLETLGDIMSAAPFGRALEVFRYSAGNASLPCLVACATRQQASDMASYLRVHRPPGAPEPALLLGETTAPERRRILADFEQGALDTIIQVGVLIEGWNSPRCKLLIDLAPSASRVRAMQKYFRVMTRDGEREARIYVVLPKSLPILPVLPTDFFGASAREYECGALVGDDDATAAHRPRVVVRDHDVVEHVSLVARILTSRTLTPPLLRANNTRDVARVVRSNPSFDPREPCGPFGFRRLQFSHRLFAGSGDALLRWLGYAPTNAAYERFLARYFPDVAAERFLRRSGVSREPAEAEVDEVVVQRDPPRDPAAILEQLELGEQIAWMLGRFRSRERRLVARRFGLFGEPALTLEELAEEEGVTRERVRGIIAKVVRQLAPVGPARTRDDWPPATVRVAGGDRQYQRGGCLSPLIDANCGWRVMSRALAPNELPPAVAAWASVLGVNVTSRGEAGGSSAFADGLLDIETVTFAIGGCGVLVELARSTDPMNVRRATSFAEVRTSAKFSLRLWGDQAGFRWYGLHEQDRFDHHAAHSSVGRIERAWLAQLASMGITRE